MTELVLTPKEQEARKRVCLPLDNLKTIEAAEARVQELSPIAGLYKVGKGSFTRFGPDIVRMVQGNVANVFLDLKYKDIPNTVEDAAAAATELGVYMFNVHATGGKVMMAAALRGARTAAAEHGVEVPKVIAVTVLTSLDTQILNEQLGINETVEEHVLRLALLTRDAGLDGIVCAAKDLSYITPHLPDDFLYVTPGIKGPNTPAGADQKRVMTPGNAIVDGSSTLVIGRAITGPKTPEARLQAGYEVLQDMAKYL